MRESLTGERFNSNTNLEGEIFLLAMAREEIGTLVLCIFKFDVQLTINWIEITTLEPVLNLELIWQMSHNPLVSTHQITICCMSVTKKMTDL